MIFSLREIGSACKDYRLYDLKEPQTRVALETGYSVESVSAFENGRVNNLVLYLWYYDKGLDLKQKVRDMRDGKL